MDGVSKSDGEPDKPMPNQHLPEGSETPTNPSPDKSDEEDTVITSVEQLREQFKKEKDQREQDTLNLTASLAEMKKPAEPKPSESPAEKRPIPEEIEFALGGLVSSIQAPAPQAPEALPVTEVILETAQLATEVKSGKSAEDYFVEGEAVAKAKDYDTALKLFTAALGLDAQNHKCLFYKAACHYHKGDVDHAILDLNAALTLAPKTKEYQDALDACVEEVKEKKAAEAAIVPTVEAALEQTLVEVQKAQEPAQVESQPTLEPVVETQTAQEAPVAEVIATAPVNTAKPAAVVPPVPAPIAATPATPWPVDEEEQTVTHIVDMRAANAVPVAQPAPESAATPQPAQAAPADVSIKETPNAASNDAPKEQSKEQLVAPATEKTAVPAAITAAPIVEDKKTSTTSDAASAQPIVTTVQEPSVPTVVNSDDKKAAESTSVKEAAAAPSAEKPGEKTQEPETKGLNIRKGMILSNVADTGTAKHVNEGERMNGVDPSTMGAAEAASSKADERGKERVYLLDVPQEVGYGGLEDATKTQESIDRRKITIAVRKELNEAVGLNEYAAAEKQKAAWDEKERKKTMARQKAFIKEEELTAEEQNDPIVKAATSLRFNDGAMEEHKGIIEKAEQKKAEYAKKKVELREGLGKEYVDIETKYTEQCKAIEAERQAEAVKIKETNDLELAKKLNAQEEEWKAQARREIAAEKAAAAGATVAPAAQPAAPVTPAAEKTEVKSARSRFKLGLPAWITGGKKEEKPVVETAPVAAQPVAPVVAQPAVTPAPAADKKAETQEVAGPGWIKRGTLWLLEKTKNGGVRTWNGLKYVGDRIRAGVKAAWNHKGVRYGLVPVVALTLAAYGTGAVKDWSAKRAESKVIRPRVIKVVKPKSVMPIADVGKSTAAASAVPVAAVAGSTAAAAGSAPTEAKPEAKGMAVAVKTETGVKMVYLAPGQAAPQAPATDAQKPKHPRHRNKGHGVKAGTLPPDKLGVANSSGTVAGVDATSVGMSTTTLAALADNSIPSLLRDVTRAFEDGKPLPDDPRVLRASERVCVNMGSRRDADRAMKNLAQKWTAKGSAACVPGGNTCFEKPSRFGRRLCGSYTGTRAKAAARSQ